MNNQEVIDTLSYTIKMYEDFENYSKKFQFTIETLETTIKVEEAELKIVQDSAVYYKKSQDILYEKSIGALKELINSALRFVFYDKNYEIDIDLEDKRGTKNLSFSVIDLDNGGFKVSLRNGCGNGVRSVVSVVLNLFVLINAGSTKLILDEKYSNLSVDYLQNLFTFIDKICISNQFKIVLITHDERFLEFANRSYRVVDGKVELVMGEEVSIE